METPADNPDVIIIDDEIIELDENGIEVRSEEEDPTQSDLDFIAADDEVEIEEMVAETVCEEMDDSLENEVIDLGEPVAVPPTRLTRQRSSGMKVDEYGVDDEDCPVEEEDEDYVPGDSGDEGDYDDDDDSEFTDAEG